MMNCKHEVERVVHKRSLSEEGQVTVIEELVLESTFVDMDLHRYRCSLCGQVGYYSSKAREHFLGLKHHAFISESNERYSQIGK